MVTLSEKIMLWYLPTASEFRSDVVYQFDLILWRLPTASRFWPDAVSQFNDGAKAIETNYRYLAFLPIIRPLFSFLL